VNCNYSPDLEEVEPNVPDWAAKIAEEPVEKKESATNSPVSCSSTLSPVYSPLGTGKDKWVLFIVLAIMLLMPTIGYCSVESTLSNIQNKLINVILPLVAILGLVWAGLSFVMGNQNARNHLMLAIFGAIVGFGAPSIVNFIRGVVN